MNSGLRITRIHDSSGNIVDTSAYRAGALIIRDKKLLKVTGYLSDVYWTLGGRLHEGETSADCVRRELQEELGITKAQITYAFSRQGSHYATSGQLKRFNYFLVEVSNDDFIFQDGEIEKYHWFSRAELESHTALGASGIQADLVPWLVKQGLL